jgi:hypothetical protein
MLAARMRLCLYLCICISDPCVCARVCMCVGVCVSPGGWAGSVWSEVMSPVNP